MNQNLPTKENAKEWLLDNWTKRTPISLVHKVSSDVIFALSDVAVEIHRTLKSKEERYSFASFTLDCGIGANPARNDPRTTFE